jgi:predicted RNA-binding protein (virulence factor B family)
MVKIGKINQLRIVKEVDFGMYLDGGEDFGEILLPIRYVTPACIVDEVVDVFSYLDSEDRLIATTDYPYAMVDDFAFLDVIAATKIGAFLDWGLMKDLLVPFKEQHKVLEVGETCFVKIYLDDVTERIVASTKINQFINNEPPNFKPYEEVDLLVYSKTDLGYKVIINEVFGGLIYHNEVFKPINRGDTMKGYIKMVREDDKIDVCLQRPGYSSIEGVAKDVLQEIEKQGGEMNVSDKSSPEAIQKIFGISTKSFKKSMGDLYKKQIITIGEGKITIN